MSNKYKIDNREIYSKNKYAEYDLASDLMNIQQKTWLLSHFIIEKYGTLVPILPKELFVVSGCCIMGTVDV